MVLILIRRGSEIPVGRAAGLIYAGIDAIWPIVGKYGSSIHCEMAGGVKVLQTKLCVTLTELGRRLCCEPISQGNVRGWWGDYKVVCDETINTPQLIEEGRIAVSIFIKPYNNLPEYCGGTFILGRAVDNGRAYMEVEYRPLAGM